MTARLVLLSLLAGQKAGYLAGQLAAFKEGERKNDLMNAIAAQLDADDIADVSAFFAGLPGAPALPGPMAP